jgi:hypothetical protein
MIDWSRSPDVERIPGKVCLPVEPARRVIAFANEAHAPNFAG